MRTCEIADPKGYEPYGWDEAVEMDEENEEWED